MVESAGERDDEAETRSYNWPAIGFSLVSARRLQLMKSSTVESTLERRDVNCMLAKGTCHQGRGLLPIILRSAIFFFFSHHLFLPSFSFARFSFFLHTPLWKGRIAESTGCIMSSSSIGMALLLVSFILFIRMNFASTLFFFFFLFGFKDRKNANLFTYRNDRLKIVQKEKV